MFTNQRNSLEKFSSDSKPEPASSESEMQFLARRVVYNLTKSVTKLHALKPLAVTATAQKLQFSTTQPSQSTTSQKLLTFPAFPLEETIAKFLKTTEPLLSESEQKETVAAAEKFIKGDGLKLQKLLEETAKNEKNWLAARWLNAAYLQYRDPVCVFSSPGMTFPIRKFKNDEEFLFYAAQFIFCTLKYKETIDKNQIPVQKMGKFELDNSQFRKVFGTCRIPGTPQDCLEFHPDSQHITVIYKNNFYKLPVYVNREIIDVCVLFDELQTIVKNEKPKEKGPAIGVLSSDHRDNWSAAYDELSSIAGNDKSLCAIQSSLFTVSLDENSEAADYDRLSEQLIHGGGSAQNAANRWFDKTIQVVINRNGINGFCYEHSPAEGQPIALMTDYIVKALSDPDKLGCGSKEAHQPATKLAIKTNQKVKEHIATAEKNVDKLAKDLHMKVIQYKGYGKGFMKSQKLSPDSYLQMAMQYAFYLLHKCPAPHYESAHLRIYYDGRTETIRSCSNESVAFAKAMMGNEPDDKRVELLKKAVNGHREYTTMALQGRGVDRHLLGLKLMALENKLPVPEFYKSPGVAKTAQFRLSTSQVASVNEAFMCYGPLVDNGYGCCYNPRENDVFFAVSSWRSNSETDSECFAQALQQAMDGMHQLLSRAGEKPKAKL